MSEQVLLSIQIASDASFATIILLVSRINIKILDFTVLIIVIMRIVVTFTLFKIIREDWYGFEQYDVKQLHDSVGLAYIPIMTIASANWKVDLTISTPLVLVAQFMTSHTAFSHEDNNMGCFASPKTFAQDYASRWIATVAVVAFAAYTSLKSALHQFLEKENSVAQQKDMK